MSSRADPIEELVAEITKNEARDPFFYVDPALIDEAAADPTGALVIEEGRSRGWVSVLPRIPDDQ